MAINNVYSQTPKRIYTNKPFINGMVYTNADMASGVCRAVSNLDLESSNTATKVRPSIMNKSIISGTNSKEMIFKFYNKLIVFEGFVTEYIYSLDNFINLSDNSTDTIAGSKLGVSVIDEESGNKYNIFNTIVYNDTELEFSSSELNIKNNWSLTDISPNIKIYALMTDFGEVPHVINSTDYSFLFFGVILSNNNNIIYKGAIKIYYHNSAQQVIIEVVNPYTITPGDAVNYGVNIISDNPQIYKDYLYYNNGTETYSDYGGYTDTVVDITTVQVYDAPVSALPHNNLSTASLLKGFNRNAEDYFYIRPYVALPKGNYYSTVSVKFSEGSAQTTAYYDFNKKEFVFNDVVKKGSELSAESKNDIVYSFEVPDVMNLSTENVKSDLRCTLTGLSTVSPAEFNDLYINVPDLNFSSTQSSYTYQFLDANKTAEQLELSGYGTLSPNSLYTDNTIIPFLNLNIPAQSFRFRLSDVSSDPNDPTLVPLDYTLTETVNIYNRMGSRKSINTEDYRHIYLKELHLVNDFYHEQTSYESGDTTYKAYKTIVITEGKGKNYNTAEFSIVKRSGEDPNTSYGFIKTFNIKDNNDGTVTYTLHLEYTYTEYEDGSTDNRYLESVALVSITSVPDDEPIYSSQKNIKLGVIANLALYKEANNIVIYPVIAFDTNYFVTKEDREKGTTLDRVVNKPNISSPYSLFSSVTVNYLNGTEPKNISAPYLPSTLSEYINDFVSTNKVGAPKLTHKYNFDIKNIESSIVDLASFIPNEYVKSIQTLGEGGLLTHDLNIPVYKKAFLATRFDNIPSMSMHITIFNATPNNSDYMFNAADVVVGQTANIQINLLSDSITPYNEIKLNSDIINRPNRVGLYLNHYIFYSDSATDNSLYFSYAGDVSYFPSMYIITLDNPIVHVHTHQSSLVVFTTSDIYLIYGGNVPSTTSDMGDEIPFTVKLIQSGVSLGKQHINTVSSIGKDVFFINSSNNGYLLKSNKYVNDASDTYLIKVTTSIDDLINSPYAYATKRLEAYGITPSKDVKPVMTSRKLINVSDVSRLNSSTDYYSVVDVPSADITNFEIIDGDTLKKDEIKYRLAGINCPEDSSIKERLGNFATAKLTHLINFAKANNKNIRIFIPKDSKGNEILDIYNRKIAYIIILSGIYHDNIFINAELLNNGLAYLQYDDYSSALTVNADGVDMSLHSVLVYAAAKAKRFNIGVHNNLDYSSYNFDKYSSSSIPVLDLNSEQKYVYANSSYIYIIQSIHLYGKDNLTIIYKYSIDTRTWTTYDFLGCVCPYDYTLDSSKPGFKLYCSNIQRNLLPKVTSLTFKNDFIDVNQIKYDSYPIGLNTALSTPINVYFDSGNQSLSLMNDKLFREVKIVLGDPQNDNLNIDYYINLYVDGKLVSPNVHYKGKQIDSSGFKTITFFTPSRGRIPRVEFNINCESDLNILQFAIVYMQLNAK